MKTVIATIALSLVSAVSFAKSVDSVTNRSGYIDGSAYELAQLAALGTSNKSRAEVIAELKAAPRLPGFIDGSAYEMAHAMFMSTRSREDVRAEARAARSLNVDLDSNYRN
jgi:hypothetical protein